MFKRLGRHWQIFLCLILSLIGVIIAYQVRTPFSIDVGGQTDRQLLSWVYDPELDKATGIRYRWTTEATEIILNDWGTSQPFELGLRVKRQRPDNRPSNLAIFLNEQELANLPANGTDWQDYRFLVNDPRFLNADDLHIKLVAETFPLTRKLSTGSGTLQVGVQLDRVTLLPLEKVNGEWRAINGLVFTPLKLPPLDLTLYVVFGTVLLYAGLARFKVSPWLALGVALLLSIGLTVGLVLARPFITLFAQTFFVILIGGVALALLARALLPRFFAWGGVKATERELNLLAILFGIGFITKLAFLLYPQTISYDLLYHIHRLEDVLGGNLFWSIPSGENEFGGQAVPYLPSFYLWLTPLAPFVPLRLLVQLSGVLLDSLTIFFIFYWLKKYFEDGRAGLFAGAIYLLVPLAFISLSWGIYANLYGQFIMLLLILAILESYENAASLRPFVVVTLLLVLTLLSHTSVFVSVVPLLALWVALMFLGIRRVIAPRTLFVLIACVALASIVAFGTYYYQFLDLIVQGTTQIGLESTETSREVLSTLQLLQPARTEFNAVPVYLYGFGLAGLLWLLYRARRAPSEGRFLFVTLLVAWSVAFAVLLLVRAEFGFSTRYVNFFMPALALCAGAALSWVYGRGLLGRVLSWGLVLLVAAQGLYHWYVLVMFKYH